MKGGALHGLLSREAHLFRLRVTRKDEKPSQTRFTANWVESSQGLKRTSAVRSDSSASTLSFIASSIRSARPHGARSSLLHRDRLLS